MERLEFNGVFGAINAFAVDDEGFFMYLFDPRADTTIRIDIRTGGRDVLVWYDRSFHHRRWLCYCMFAFSADSSVYLPTLFYNTKRKQFILVTFVTECGGKPALYTLNENVIVTQSIRPDRLAYNAHKDDNKIHIIFYERFTRHLSADNNCEDDESQLLSYVICSYDCQTHSTTVHDGLLPSGQWELPFIAHSHLHFISTELANTQLASIPVDENPGSNDWNMQAVSSDYDGANPPRKAVWCNAWHCGMAWYIIAEKINVNEIVTKKISLWQLDVLDCQWRAIPLSLEAPSTACNFALRIEDNNVAFLHVDWERDGALFKFNLVDLMSNRPNEMVLPDDEKMSTEKLSIKRDNKENGSSSNVVTPVTPSEIVCLVCLDTYRDPRTLSCGHSICYNCAEQMKSIGKSNIIRCSICRKSTVIPACGLPVNYSLRDAIETLVKAKQLKLSGLRCSRCRKSCEDRNLWVCTECASQTDFEDLSDGLLGYTKRGKRHSFCAQCVLKYHANHRVNEYAQFRERCAKAEKLNEKCQKMGNELLLELSDKLNSYTDQLIITRLKSDIRNDLIEALNTLSVSDDQMPLISDNAIASIKQRIDLISNAFEDQLTDIFDQCSRSHDGPTKL